MTEREDWIVSFLVFMGLVMCVLAGIVGELR